jgi:hypothetical protein
MLGKELVALAINLSLNDRNADLVGEEELAAIVQRAMQHQDVLLFRFIKGIIDKSSNPAI